MKLNSLVFIQIEGGVIYTIVLSNSYLINIFYQQTPLWIACYRKHEDVVKELLNDNRVKVNEGTVSSIKLITQLTNIY